MDKRYVVLKNIKRIFDTPIHIACYIPGENVYSLRVFNSSIESSMFLTFDDPTYDVFINFLKTGFDTFEISARGSRDQSIDAPLGSVLFFQEDNEIVMTIKVKIDGDDLVFEISALNAEENYDPRYLKW